MPPKRVATKPAAGPSPSSPMVNLMLLGSALAYGLWTLVQRGRVSWPPHDLLSNTFTVAGCLGLVGPIVLGRRESGGGGLGDLLWMTGGVLIWTFDLAALVRGEGRDLAWATPLGAQPMGLTMLAVLLAGWRARAGGRDWSWTNVTGWVLGLLWVGLGLASFVPTRVLPGVGR